MNKFTKGTIIKMSGLSVKKENGVFEIESTWEKSCSVYKLKKDGSRIKNGLDIFKYDKIEKYGEVITLDQVSATITEINKQLKERKENEVVISYVLSDKKEYENKTYIRVIEPIQTTSSIYAIPRKVVFQLSIIGTSTSVVWKRVGKRGELLSSLDTNNIMSWSPKSMEKLFANGYIEIVERVEAVRKDIEEEITNETVEAQEVIETAMAEVVEEMNNQESSITVEVQESQENSLIGRKVFGQWGVMAGWDYGVIISETIHNEVVIKWEEGREEYLEIENLVHVHEHTNLDKAGVYLLPIEEAHITEDTMGNQETSEFDTFVNETMNLDHFKGYTFDGCGYCAGCIETVKEQVTDIEEIGVVHNFEEWENGLSCSNCTGEIIAPSIVEEETEQQSEIVETVTATQETPESNNEITYQTGTGLKGNGIEINFPEKPSEDVRNLMKANKYRWAGKQRPNVWWAILNDETLSIAEQIAGNKEETVSEPVTFEEVDIDDIESYVIDQKVQDREHDANWIFRTKRRNHNEEIQELFTEYTNKVKSIISGTNNEYYIYKLKSSLQRFKKKYHEAYVKWLSAKGNHVSWAVSGRGNLNVSKYNKAMNRVDNLMLSLSELTSEMDKSIKYYANKIKKQHEEVLKKEIASTPTNITFTMETKEFTYMNYNEKKRVHVSGEYWIVRIWGCFRIFRGNKEVHSLKTTQKLDDAKQYVSYLIHQQQEQKAI